MKTRIFTMIVLFVLSIAAHAQDWKQVSNMLASRNGHGAATGPDGMVYVVGGLLGQAQCVATMEQYNPFTNTWTSVPGMSVARCHPGVVTGADGYIYVIGGDIGNASTDLVERYDTKTKKWQTVAPMNVKRGRPGVAVGPDLRIYAMGGYHSPSSTQRSEIEVYDAAANTWTVVNATAPGVRIAATSIDGNIHAFGVGPGAQWAAFDGSSLQFHGNVYPLSNGDFSAAAGPDGRTYLPGVGTGGPLNGSSDFATLDENGIWGKLQELLHGRGSAGAATAAEGQLFLTGGYRKSSPGQLPYAESYGPLKAAFPAGAKAFWKFDEAAGNAVTDPVGSTTGAINGGAARIAGRVEKALTFDGKNQFVRVDNAPAVNFGSGGFTIEGWLRWTPVGLHVTTVLDKRTNAAGKYQGYSLFIYRGRLGFQLANGTTYTNYGATNSIIEPNQWMHFAVTIDRSSNRLTFYVNGVVDPSQHVPIGGDVTNAAPLMIARHSLDSSFYTGAIDELTLYDRPLRWAEIRAIFLAGREGK